MLARSQIIASRIRTETDLLTRPLGFTATFLAVKHLSDHVDASVSDITSQTVKALLVVIKNPIFHDKKQAYFLYRDAIFPLIRISIHAAEKFRGPLVRELQKLLFAASGSQHRAISEALGSLPLRIERPRLKTPEPADQFLTLRFDDLLAHCGVETDKILPPHRHAWKGRTLILNTSNEQRCCIKFIRTNETAEPLDMEAQWLLSLSQSGYRNDLQGLPRPVIIDGHTLFRLERIPRTIGRPEPVCHTNTAICYLTDSRYFHYPNEPALFAGQVNKAVKSFALTARQLGRLTAGGIVHTALIPLFHNRTQQNRRQDGGKYNWEQGGRLDQWLSSSRFPNFSSTGLRDFEHLEIIETSGDLRHYIGEHILSFILVAGSFFRNQFPDKTGVDDSGTALDLRHAFDPGLFSAMVSAVVREYYHGLTGNTFRDIDSLMVPALIEHLIQAMGRDLHMDETLRVHDQEQMTEPEFHDFLILRGLDPENAAQYVKGRQDIRLETGPHLGGFNQPISVPELIDFLFRFSALCISDRFLMENGLKGAVN